MKKTRRITLGAALCALNLLAILGASLLPTGRLACWFLSSLFAFALLADGDFSGAALVCAATCVLAFFLLPNKLSLAPYPLLLGHFGIFKTYLDSKLENKAVRLLLCVLYCDLFAAVGLLLFSGAFLNAPALSRELPWYVAIPAAQLFFAAYTLLYTLCQRWYVNGPLYKALAHKK